MNRKFGKPSRMFRPAQRVRWGELPPAQRAAGVLIGLIQFSLLIAALVDLRRRPAEQIRGDKRIWMFVVFINWIGPISYFMVGRRRQQIAATR